MFKNTYPSYFIEQKYTKLNIYIYTYILCNVTKEYIYVNEYKGHEDIIRKKVDCT